MDNLLQGFKTNLGGTVFKLTTKSWMQVLIIMVLSSIVSVGINILLFGAGMYSALFAMMQDPMGMMDMAQSDPTAFMSMMGGGAAAGMGLMILSWVIGLIIGCWAWVCYYMINSHHAAGTYSNFGEILGKSFNANIFKFFGWALLMGVMYIVMAFIMGLIVGLIQVPLLMIPLIFVVFAVLLMFSLIPPAIVNGGMSFGDAFGFSLRHMKFGRSLLTSLVIFGIMLVMGLVVAGIMLAVGSIGGMAAIILLIVVMLLVGSFAYSLFASIFSGLYYKYADAEAGGNMDLEDHLISDNE